ncbi:MAG TPA: anthranilate phosphoribosyltransferase [Solirubrobacteraceae bacterium]|nr:anthranilate phosphoribosyltransferase [Solirubrobacteraceae bacterium]
MISETIDRLLAGEALSAGDTEEAVGLVMRGEADPAQIAGLLVALRAKGETVDELVGAARAMRSHVVPVRPSRADLVDTAGTGGDGSGTFNISTTAAIVAAACGCAVAKHGNRAASSRSGSADMLEALGVPITLAPEQAAEMIDRYGFGYLHAPAHHPAMRHAGPVRRSLGVRTVFNLLGPLTNPAGARRQVIGVYAVQWVEPMGRALAELGCEHGMVVHGRPGIDELSPCGVTTVATVRDGSVTIGEVDARELGVELCTLGDLAGGDPQRNAEITLAVLRGEEGPAADATALNAAATLVVAGRAADLGEGLEVAREALRSGAAMATLSALRAAGKELR